MLLLRFSRPLSRSRLRLLYKALLSQAVDAGIRTLERVAYPVGVLGYVAQASLKVEERLDYLRLHA